jgi:hypothetical protein
VSLARGGVIAAAGSRHEHELALDLAALEPGEGLAGAVEREGGVDVRAEVAVGDGGEDADGVGAVAGTSRAAKEPQNTPTTCAAL